MDLVEPELFKEAVELLQVRLVIRNRPRGEMYCVLRVGF
jgi:hypothetical protein